MDIKFHMGVLCSCGWYLEEDSDAPKYLGTVTVKPCPHCCHGKAQPEPEKQRGRYGSITNERAS